MRKLIKSLFCAALGVLLMAGAAGALGRAHARIIYLVSLKTSP